MDAVTFIWDTLRQVHLRLSETCQGLTQDEVLWRPFPYANNIGFILWHMTRAEDNVISSLSSPESALWVAQGWHKKFNQPVEAPDPGDRMGLQSLPIPNLVVLTGYSEAVHEKAQSILPELPEERLNEARDPNRPQRTVAMTLRHLITHKNNHHGQIDYIRGLQDQSWDLPPGTGIVLPDAE